MPAGTFVVDHAQAFQCAYFMNSGPTDTFGQPGVQEKAADGTWPAVASDVTHELLSSCQRPTMAARQINRIGDHQIAFRMATRLIGCSACQHSRMPITLVDILIRRYAL